MIMPGVVSPPGGVATLHVTLTSCPVLRSVEVWALLVALYALVVGPFRHWRASVVATYAAITGILIYLTNE